MRKNNAMTNDQNHPEHAQESNQPMNIAALLRAAADGELTDHQCEQLDAYMSKNPEAESQIKFEQALKGSCGRVMTRPCCPDALRDKIVAMAGVADQESQVYTQQYAQGIEASNKRTRSSSFWSRSPMMGIAAAVLMMVAGTMIWQSASFTNISNAPEGLNVQQANYYNRVSNFVIDEHKRCGDDSAATAKLIRHDIDEATRYFSEEFGRELVLPDMVKAEGQIEFFGGGDCSVPSTPRSGHLRFDAYAPDGKRISLSLFVSPDPGLLPMQEGITYPLDTKACQEAGTRLFAWSKDGIQYLLVSEASDEMCAKVRNMMQAPSALGDL